MAILVTGGTGFLGANVVRLLAEQGRDIVAYDVLPPAPASVFADVIDHVKVEIGNVTDLSHVLHVIKRNKVEGIIHTAAIVTGAANAHPLEALQVNIIGSANMLEAARIMDLKRVIIFSSSSVMGGPEDFITPRKEEEYSLPLSSIYPVSKLTCEQLTYTYRELYKVDAITVRPCGGFGPGEKRARESDAPIFELVKDAVEGKAIRRETGGDTAKDLTYVKDFAKGVVQAYDCKAPRYYLYNISFGKNRTVFQICDVLRQVFPGLPIEVGPGLWSGALKTGKQADLTYRRTQRPPQDITRAREDFGFEPEWDLDRAIPHWVRWLKEGKYG
ncbi:NAD-dependent epimerase/dehydratase family protein [Chloroflexota bacterium]